MKRYFNVTALALLLSCYVQAQVTETDYKPIASQGSIPQEFLTRSSEKYESQVKEIPKDAKKRDKKAKTEFYMSSNFELDNFLLSGKVSFNDPVTIYVNKVLESLIKDDKELKGKVRVYTVKSTSVNAFSTDRGVILINLGLLAQLENEAQLAFVLSHELVHYQKKHAVTMYSKAKTISEGKGLYKDFSYDDKMIAKSSYSKELETQADEEGLKRYLKSGYSLDALNGAFDVLEFAYLPFDEVVYDKGFLETPNLIFPSDFYLETVKPIKSDDEKNAEDDDSDTDSSSADTKDDDAEPKAKASTTKSSTSKSKSSSSTSKSKSASSKSSSGGGSGGGSSNNKSHSKDLSTHPSVPARRANIMAKIKGVDNTGKQKFLISQEEFTNTRNMARFELSRLYLMNLDYEPAIYNSYLLLKQFPKNLYLKKIVAKSLLGLTAYNNDSIFHYVNVSPDNIQGESQRLYFMIDKISESKPALNTVALSYAWKVRQEYPQDKEIKAICDELLETMVKDLKLKPEKFSAMSRPATLDSIKQVVAKKDTAVPKEKMSKYDKIKKTKEKEVIKGDDASAYYTYAFAEYFKDADFEKAFKDKVKEHSKDKRKEHLSAYERYKQDAKEQKRQVKKGYALDIKKIAIVEPFYAKLDLRPKHKGYDYLKSEVGTQKLDNEIKENSKLAGLSGTVLTTSTLKTADVQNFNDIATLNEWFSERMNHSDDVELSGMDKSKVDSLVAKYGTKYFLWTGVVTTKDINHARLFYILYGSIFWPTMPIMFPIAFSPVNRTYYFYVLYDIETNTMQSRGFKIFKEKDRISLMNSQLYTTYSQIHRKHK